MTARDSLPKAASLEKIEAPSAEVAEAQRKAVQRDIADNVQFSEAVRDLDKLNEAAPGIRLPTQPGKRATVKTEKSDGSDADRLTSPSLRKLLEPGEKDTPPASVTTTDGQSKVGNVLIGLIGAGIAVVLLLAVIVIRQMTSNAATSKPMESGVPTTTATASETSRVVQTSAPPVVPTSAAPVATSVEPAAPSSSPVVKSSTATVRSAKASVGPSVAPPPPPPPPNIVPPTTAPAASSGVKPWFKK